MEHLNFHHLRLFREVAQEGNLRRASKNLHLTPQAVSAQVKSLEAAIGEPLFLRSGGRLVLTGAGQVALQYSDEIFSLGRELQETLRGQPEGRPLRIALGALDVLPKLIVHRLVEPALHLRESSQIVCSEGSLSSLLGDLAVHRLDVVLSDSPIPPTASVRAYNHLLGSCGVTIMAHRDLARGLRRGFPESLDRAPVLLPAEPSVLRRDLVRWFEQNDVRPVIVGEFVDSALLKSFGQAAVGFFAVPSVVKDEVRRQYRVQEIGEIEEVTESYYAISVERRVRHPAVAAICEAARGELFFSQDPSSAR